MPELPEVETIKLGLQKKIIGLTIKKIEVLSPKTFQGKIEDVRGRKVLNIWRKAKILGIELDSSLRGVKRRSNLLNKQDRHGRQGDLAMTIMIHLKMTGQLIHTANVKSLKTNDRFIGGHPTPDMIGPLPNKSTRVIFTFSSGSKLFFNDQRRFGWVRVVDREQVTVDSLFKKLGPEPLEKGFSWQILKSNLLNHKSLPIKVTLMDQSVVSGIGNIYANEACFNAKLDPRTKVSNLNDLSFKKLHLGMIKALRDGIKYGGSSRAHFVDSEGHKGYFLDYAFVYGRDSHPCKICKTEIKKVQLGGRGTYLCPKCQKA